MARAVILAFAFAGVATAQPSAKSCSQLGANSASPFYKSIVDGFGSRAVCGASRVATGSSNALGPACADAATYAVADATCKSVGARLCTSQEIANDETRNTGCDFDFARVWSSSSCAAGRVTTLAGASMYLDRVPMECTVTSGNAAIRCCADEYSAAAVPVPTPAAVPKANPCGVDYCHTLNGPNTCTPSGSSYTCTCGAGWRLGQGSQSCCQDPCASNPCSTSLNPGNRCTSGSAFGADGCAASYTCTCATGFVATADAKACQSCGNPCASDPCNTKGNAGNACMVANAPAAGSSCVGYTCRCAESFALVTNGPASTCVVRVCTDPCSSKPCGAGGTCAPLPNNSPAGTTRQFAYPQLFQPVYQPAPAFVCGFTCTCGDTYIVSADLQSCTSCANPCSSDPCSTAQEPNNKCTVQKSATPGRTCGGYVCKCGEGWLYTQGAKSCVPCPNPCSSDPCSSSFDIANQCTVSGYLPAVSSKRQYPVPLATTLQVPVPTQGPAVVQVQQNVCPGYTCTCGGAAWLATNDQAKSCTPCGNPCQQADPCFTRLDSNNRCIVNTQGTTQSKCPGFICVCSEGWIVTPNAQTCQACSNPCVGQASDPCHTEATGNACVADFLPAYLRVIPTAQQLGGMSLSGAFGSNYPVFSDQKCSGFVCACKASGWLTGAGDQACSPCPDMCSIGDPCGSGADSHNLCYPTVTVAGVSGRQPTAPAGYFNPADGTCGSFVCSCAASGWIRHSDKKSCRLCNDPCEMDPCNNSNDTKNVCRPVVTRQAFNGVPLTMFLNPNPVSPVSIASSASVVVSEGNCSGYTCSCDGDGWIAASAAKQHCTPCPNPCNNIADPCRSSNDAGNICVPDVFMPVVAGVNDARRQFASLNDQYKCGGFTCRCNGSGWLLSGDRKSCTACVNPCAKDPCNSHMTPENRCIPDLGFLGDPAWGTAMFRRTHQSTSQSQGCGGYRCECAEYGWLIPADAQTCNPCPDPCSPSYIGDPCRSSESNLNRCVGDVVPGASQPAFASISIPYANPLLASVRRTHDTTLLGGVGNCPGFTCQCGTGWVQPQSAQTCEPCPNPCLGKDPCKTGMSNGSNQCVPTYALRRTHDTAASATGSSLGCGGYTCQCNGEGWTTPVGSQTCEECPNPCTTMGDPCGSSVDPRNRCVRQDGSIRRQAVGTPPGLITMAQFQLMYGTPTYSTPTPNFGVSAPPVLTQRPITILQGTSAPSTVNSRCGAYSCICGGDNFVLSQDTKKCTPCPDPCLSDPCRARVGVNNRCIRQAGTANLGVGVADAFRSCSGYICECGMGFVEGSGTRSCEPCPNPCAARDPCRTAANPSNKCIPDLGTPAFTSQNLANVALGYVYPGRRLMNHLEAVPEEVTGIFSADQRCGAYVCQCVGPSGGWVNSLNSLTCDSCANPCMNGDPCSSNQDPRNQCVPGATVQTAYAANPFSSSSTFYDNTARCGQFTCVCGGVGFVAQPGATSCRACPNACAQGDPCNSSADPGNRCTPTSAAVGGLNPYGSGIVGGFGTQSGSLASQCGGYTCTCNSINGFVATAGLLACQRGVGVTACADPCVISDPCSVRQNPLNRCQARPEVQCGFYQCSCDATRGWVQVQANSFVGPSCQGPAGSSVAAPVTTTTTGCPREDPCRTAANGGLNVCRAAATAVGFQCLCREPYVGTGTSSCSL